MITRQCRKQSTVDSLKQSEPSLVRLELAFMLHTVRKICTPSWHAVKITARWKITYHGIAKHTSITIWDPLLRIYGCMYSNKQVSTGCRRMHTSNEGEESLSFDPLKPLNSRSTTAQRSPDFRIGVEAEGFKYPSSTFMLPIDGSKASWTLKCSKVKTFDNLQIFKGIQRLEDA